METNVGPRSLEVVQSPSAFSLLSRELIRFLLDRDLQAADKMVNY